MNLTELEEQLKSLTEQQKQAEINFHQIAGAIAMTQQLLEKAKAKDSGDEKKPKK